MIRKFPGTREQEALVLEQPKKYKPSKKSAGFYTDRQLDLDYPVESSKDNKSGVELSTFNIIVLLVIAALVITAYISNIIRVDALMLEFTKLERQESKLLQVRENLRADINSLTSYNRIQNIATEELGLVHSRQQPFKLNISETP